MNFVGSGSTKSIELESASWGDIVYCITMIRWNRKETFSSMSYNWGVVIHRHTLSIEALLYLSHHPVYIIILWLIFNDSVTAVLSDTMFLYVN